MKILHNIGLDHSHKLNELLDEVPRVCNNLPRKEGLAYIFEKRMLLESLGEGDPDLIQKAGKILKRFERKILRKSCEKE